MAVLGWHSTRSHVGAALPGLFPGFWSFWWGKQQTLNISVSFLCHVVTVGSNPSLLTGKNMFFKCFLSFRNGDKDLHQQRSVVCSSWQQPDVDQLHPLQRTHKRRNGGTWLYQKGMTKWCWKGHKFRQSNIIVACSSQYFHVKMVKNM